MAARRIGKNTMLFQNPPSILSFASVAGKKEGEGPLAGYIDFLNEDTTFGEKSWEKAESRMQKEVLQRILAKGDLSPRDIQCIFAGDLLNQCIGSTFGLRESNIPMIGLFGACSTMAESILMGAMMIDGGGANRVIALTSSHFCSAERQFRYPLEYGGQRPPTSQWTVTGAGGMALGAGGQPPYITHGIIGTIVDMGICDANNMGAAMAPAAYTTIAQFLEDTGFLPEDFDLIVTGDLGVLGKTILKDFFLKEGLCLDSVYDDCGCMIFDVEKQDVHSGASGCGCSAVVLNSYLLSQMKKGIWNRILFVATGALMSPTSATQGESIPAIAHGVVIDNHLPI